MLLRLSGRCYWVSGYTQPVRLKTFRLLACPTTRCLRPCSRGNHDHLASSWTIQRASAGEPDLGLHGTTNDLIATASALLSLQCVTSTTRCLRPCSRSTRHSKRPIVLCSCPQTRNERLSSYFSLVSQYKDASARYLKGDLSAPFPPGTYRPPLLCAERHLARANTRPKNLPIN